MVDDEILRQLRNLHGQAVSVSRLTLLYSWLETVFTASWLSLFPLE